MTVTAKIWCLGLLAAVVTAACAPTSQPERSPSNPADGPRVALGARPHPKHLIMSFRFEKNDLSTKTLSQGGQGYRPLFNAGLAYVDGAGALQPYLAASLPKLNSESWRVAPDGTMETTWQLRHDLTWHDGEPLTADDFVFAWTVYSAPGLGIFSPLPQRFISEARAPDPQTVVFTWNAIYADAVRMTSVEFPPLPRHVLGDAFAAVEQDPAGREVFVNHRYWNSEYVGAGAYRVDQIEPGTSVDGVAFDGHALGRPKIDRITARIISDENTVLSSILSEAIQVTSHLTLRFEHAQVLQREWAATRGGTLTLSPSRLVGSIVQFRPEYQRTPALLDVRVRRAMVHAIDRQALNDGLYEGQSINPDTLLNPKGQLYARAINEVTKYPFDPRRTEQLFNEAGFAKDQDGFFADASGTRLRPDYRVLAGTQFERGGAIITETWRRAGIDVQHEVLPAAQVRQNEVRNKFPGIATPGSMGGRDESALEFFTTRQIGTEARGWTGQNRGGWSNPQVDQLWEAYNVTLDPDARARHAVQLMKIISDEVPAWPLYWDFNVLSHLPTVRGPDLGIVNTSTPFWNVHEWEMR